MARLAPRTLAFRKTAHGGRATWLDQAHEGVHVAWIVAWGGLAERQVMVELTEDGRALIAALVGAPVAWQTPDELAGSTGFDLEKTTDLLAILDDGGWICAWERPDDVVVTLSVSAASRLGVRLVEDGPGSPPRWAASTDPDPPQPRASGVFRCERLAGLELVVDPNPGPDHLAEWAESPSARQPARAGRRDPIRDRALPRPTILVGTGLSPWPGPREVDDSPCPACLSRHLSPSAYCLRCDRWGLDHLLREGPAPRPETPRNTPESSSRRERERRRRREKRLARLESQAEAEKSARRRKPDGSP